MKSSSPPRKKFLKDFNVKVATDDIDNVTSSWMLKYPSSALNSFEKIINYPKSKKIVMFLDYDGTLSPVVDGPDRALMSDAIIECFSLVSYEFEGLNELYYAASHGMDIIGPARHTVCNDHPICIESSDEQEGTSNYFKGLMLIICYLIVAASFFVHIDPTSIVGFAADKPSKH
ncbi:hypothetical protein VitviT2T_016931 [Vitis vinifera]|uniref:Uncharacterized protein n=1 Tax=Vitis vinifera TaxID=29760 RepID=A0ABY9CW54_VITVI|nr:hypothetical protein VitviT2T_016931 [Vitis vinifera]